MNHKHKLALGTGAVMTIALVVAVSFSGASEDLQGRFSVGNRASQSGAVVQMSQADPVRADFLKAISDLEVEYQEASSLLSEAASQDSTERKQSYVLLQRGFNQAEREIESAKDLYAPYEQSYKDLLDEHNTNNERIRNLGVEMTENETIRETYEEIIEGLKENLVEIKRQIRRAYNDSEQQTQAYFNNLNQTKWNLEDEIEEYEEKNKALYDEWWQLSQNLDFAQNRAEELLADLAEARSVKENYEELYDSADSVFERVKAVNRDFEFRYPFVVE